jgi:hypothetical protein
VSIGIPVAAEATIRYLAVAKEPVRAGAPVSDEADALLHSVKAHGEPVFRVLVNVTGEDQTRVQRDPTQRVPDRHSRSRTGGHGAVPPRLDPD